MKFAIYLDRFILCGVAIVSCSESAFAQNYPYKPVRMVVGFAPGGGPDLVARLVAPRLAEGLGQQVVVDNRPGAGGSIGEDIVAKATPDGYTILMCASSIAIIPSLYKKLPYDSLRDLAPVSLVGNSARVLVVNAALPVKSIKELVTLARSKRGQLTFASSGKGSGSHLDTELLKVMTGIDILHVAYKGSAPGLLAVLSGEVSMVIAPLASALPYVRAGKLRALGVTTAKRAAAVPDIPTIAEAGVLGYEAAPWWGILATAGTPKQVIGRLNAEIVKIVRLPDIKEQFANLGVEPVSNAPEEFAAYIKGETTKWANVVREANIRAD